MQTKDKTVSTSINQEVRCQIRDRKIKFFGKEKQLLFDKITERMNSEFENPQPNSNRLQVLRKKLAVLENTYDGVISLEKEDYHYNIFAKWNFFPM